MCLPGSYLIIGVSVLFALGVATTYTMSVAEGHTTFLWCFISYTGNFPVESCVFSLVFNSCSAIYLLIVMIRFNQVSRVIDNGCLRHEEEQIRRRNKLNIAATVLGFLGALGLSIIGCFQQRNFYVMHAVGVTMCIGGTNTYFIFQTYFSFTILSGKTRLRVKIFRLVVVVLSSIAFVAGVALLVYSFIRFPQWRKLTMMSTNGSPKSDVYKIGSVLEWLIFFLFQFFIYSFVMDFEKVALKSDQLVFLE